MGQVAITLNNRTYRLVCGDGEEDHLANLAGIVKSKIETLRADIGNVGDERLMLMAALLIADELVEARSTTARLAEAGDQSLSGEHEAVSSAVQADAQKLRAAATRMADIAKPRDGNSAAESGGKAVPQFTNQLPAHGTRPAAGRR